MAKTASGAQTRHWRLGIRRRYEDLVANLAKEKANQGNFSEKIANDLFSLRFHDDEVAVLWERLSSLVVNIMMPKNTSKALIIKQRWLPQGYLT